MKFAEKFPLATMLAEIEDDITEQKKDQSQEKNLSQETITELMLRHLARQSPSPAGSGKPAES